MKKANKIVAVVIAALLVVAALVVLTACGKTYTGEAKYTNKYGTYGVKVDVAVKGDTITAVTLYSEEDTGWVRTTASWNKHDETEAAYDKWLDDTFVGANIADVLGWSASATENGQTVGAGVEHMAGATQSSARIICAVQNALEQIEGITKVTGGCSYTTQYGTYGAKVNVYLRDGKVLAVKLLQEDETGWTRTTASWTHHDATEEAYAAWIKSTFVGKTVEEINAYVATATAEGQTLGEGTPTIQLTGATAKQSAARIIVAVQDALKNVK